MGWFRNTTKYIKYHRYIHQLIIKCFLLNNNNKIIFFRKRKCNKMLRSRQFTRDSSWNCDNHFLSPVQENTRHRLKNSFDLMKGNENKSLIRPMLLPLLFRFEQG